MILRTGITLHYSQRLRPIIYWLSL